MISPEKNDRSGTEQPPYTPEKAEERVLTINERLNEIDTLQTDSKNLILKLKQESAGSDAETIHTHLSIIEREHQRVFLLQKEMDRLLKEKMALLPLLADKNNTEVPSNEASNDANFLDEDIRHDAKIRNRIESAAKGIAAEEERLKRGSL